MPTEDIEPRSFPPRKFYFDEDLQSEIVVFWVEECLSQYLNDISSGDFSSVYEGFDFTAIYNFGIWSNIGVETGRLKELKEAFDASYSYY